MKNIHPSNKAFHHYGAQGAPRVNADVQRPDNIENYGEVATATATEKKIRGNIHATPPKMKITAENGLKIEKMGSTSPKTRFLGHFYGFRGLQA